MSSLTMNGDLVHLGMDTSKDSIVVGILRSGEQVPDIDRVFNDEASVRRLIGRFDVGAVRACYSSTPPSRDSLAARGKRRTQRSQRVRSKDRNPGGQAGRKGSGLTPAAAPDRRSD